MSTLPPWTPPTARRPNYDEIRARLNEALEAERYEEAEAIASWLRERLMRESMLDRRLRKSLSGADKVLRRLRSRSAEKASRRPQSWRGLYAALAVALVGAAVVLYMWARPPASNPEAASKVLLELDSAVTRGLSLVEYQRAMRELRGVPSDLGEVESCYDRALVDWQSSVARGLVPASQTASLRDPVSRSPWASCWRSARALLVCRGYASSPSNASSAPGALRLVGSWTTAAGELSFAPPDPLAQAGCVTLLTKGSQRAGTYEINVLDGDQVTVVVHIPSSAAGLPATLRFSANGAECTNIANGATMIRRSAVRP